MPRAITITIDEVAAFIASEGGELLRVETFFDGRWVTEYIYDSPGLGLECRITAEDLAQDMGKPVAWAK